MSKSSIGIAALAAVWLAACGGGPPPATADAVEAPVIEAWKSPACGCCSLWVDHLRAEGFEVVVHDVDNLEPVKARNGVPYGLGSCHTAEVAGYFIEGHVPAADIRRLLRERPAARGLAVPGMPLGSPGMEMGDRRDPYEVLLVGPDGTTRVYSRHGP